MADKGKEEERLRIIVLEPITVIASHTTAPYAQLYAEARGAYTACIEHERNMKQLVIEARQALMNAQRRCDELKADAIVNAEDEDSGIFATYHATNDRARRAAIDVWEASNPGYLTALQERDNHRVVLQQYEADYIVCVRSLTALRLDMEFAISMIQAVGGNA